MQAGRPICGDKRLQGQVKVALITARSPAYLSALGALAADGGLRSDQVTMSAGRRRIRGLSVAVVDILSGR
jgi:hypothetical protein